MPVCKTKEHGPQIKLVLKKAEHISVLCKYKSKSFIFLDDWMIGILVRCIYSTLEVSCLGQLIFMFSGMSEERMCVCVWKGKHICKHSLNTSAISRFSVDKLIYGDYKTKRDKFKRIL